MFAAAFQQMRDDVDIESFFWQSVHSGQPLVIEVSDGQATSDAYRYGFLLTAFGPMFIGSWQRTWGSSTFTWYDSFTHTTYGRVFAVSDAETLYDWDAAQRLIYPYPYAAGALAADTIAAWFWDLALPAVRQMYLDDHLRPKYGVYGAHFFTTQYSLVAGYKAAGGIPVHGAIAGPTTFAEILKSGLRSFVERAYREQNPMLMETLSATLVRAMGASDYKSAGLMKTGSAGAVTSSSESQWPEAPGLATKYIDNVGVYVPDFTDVDFNLSHSLGSEMLGLEVVRAPNTDVEWIRMGGTEWSAFLSFITGGAGQGAYAGARENGSSGQGAAGAAGIAGGIMNTLGYAAGVVKRQFQTARLVFPRIRSFGRQEGKRILTYAQYSSEFDAKLGAPMYTFDASLFGGSKSISYSRYVGKFCVKISQAQYDAFLTMVKGGKSTVY